MSRIPLYKNVIFFVLICIYWNLVLSFFKLVIFSSSTFWSFSFFPQPLPSTFSLCAERNWSAIIKQLAAFLVSSYKNVSCFDANVFLYHILYWLINWPPYSLTLMSTGNGLFLYGSNEKVSPLPLSDKKKKIIPSLYDAC